jgi:transcription termination/antitermination protein NusG
LGDWISFSLCYWKNSLYKMPKQQVEQIKNWYVIHTYSGYEESVAKNLKQRIESLGMEDKIFNVIVPKEKKIKIKDGKRKVVEEKIYPGYVLVEMIVTDDSWYVVRNTPNVTGFVGAGTTPVPVSLEEITTLKKKMGVETPQYKIDVEIGDAVKITDGPFKDFDGKVAEIDQERGKVKVLVNMFGRDTPVELDSLQIKKI